MVECSLPSLDPFKISRNWPGRLRDEQADSGGSSSISQTVIVFCNLTMFFSIVCGEAQQEQSLSSWPVGPNQAKNVSRQGQSESNYPIAESILKCLETRDEETSKFSDAKFTVFSEFWCDSHGLVFEMLLPGSSSLQYIHREHFLVSFLYFYSFWGKPHWGNDYVKSSGRPQLLIIIVKWKVSGRLWEKTEKEKALNRTRLL